MSLPECPTCATNAYVGPTEHALTLHCHGCGRAIEVHPSSRGFAKSTRARSDRQEKFNSRKVGGRRTSNSGAGSDKGDVKVPGVLREECKTTLAASYVLRLSDLQKVGAAARGDEIPILRIAFGDDLREQFVVLDSGWFQALFNHYTGDD